MQRGEESYSNDGASMISTVARIKPPGVDMVQSLNIRCVGLVVLNNQGKPVRRIWPCLNNGTLIQPQSVMGLFGRISHIIHAQDICKRCLPVPG